MDCLIIPDVHLSDRAPSSRRDSWADDVLLKLEWCVEYANGLNLPIVQSGDMFHLKVPWRTSYGLVQRTHDVLKRAKHGVYVVPGNHDQSNNRLESLDSQPLGALGRMGGVRLLMGADPDLPGIFGIPYLREFDGGDWPEALAPWLSLIEAHPSELVVTHAPIFPPGQEPGVYASLDTFEWSRLLGEAGVGATAYGHIHENHGQYMVEGHTFCNHGALSRGSLHEETVNRWPTITTWLGGEFAPVALPTSVVRQPKDVFLFAEAEARASARSLTEEFTAALGAVQLQNLTTEEVVAHIRSENPSAAVLRMIEECLETAGA